MHRWILFLVMILTLGIESIVHGMFWEPEEIELVANFIERDPKTALLVGCCPIYTLFGLELILRVAEKAPSYDRVRRAIAAYDCCKRIETARGNFIEAHDKGLLALHTEKPKQIKMKDE